MKCLMLVFFVIFNTAINAGKFNIRYDYATGGGSKLSEAVNVELGESIADIRKKLAKILQLPEDKILLLHPSKFVMKDEFRFDSLFLKAFKGSLVLRIIRPHIILGTNVSGEHLDDANESEWMFEINQIVAVNWQGKLVYGLILKKPSDDDIEVLVNPGIKRVYNIKDKIQLFGPVNTAHMRFPDVTLGSEASAEVANLAQEETLRHFFEDQVVIVNWGGKNIFGVVTDQSGIDPSHRNTLLEVLVAPLTKHTFNRVNKNEVLGFTRYVNVKLVKDS